MHLKKPWVIFYSWLITVYFVGCVIDYLSLYIPWIGGWVDPEPVWTFLRKLKSLAWAATRTPDRPVRRLSLYRLRYPRTYMYQVIHKIKIKLTIRLWLCGTKNSYFRNVNCVPSDRTHCSFVDSILTIGSLIFRTHKTDITVTDSSLVQYHKNE